MRKNKMNESSLNLLDAFITKWNNEYSPVFQLEKMSPTVAVGESDDKMVVVEWKEGELSVRKFELYEEDTLDAEDLASGYVVIKSCEL